MTILRPVVESVVQGYLCSPNPAKERLRDDLGGEASEIFYGGCVFRRFGAKLSPRNRSIEVAMLLAISD